MISVKLMAYCVLASGVYLLLMSLLLESASKKLGVSRGMPPAIMEPTGSGWFIVNYLMELLFFVAIPTLAYSFFYLILPLSGLRTALAVTLVAFVMGAVPILMGLSVRIKLSLPYLLFYLLGFLIKLAGSLIIIGYLYTL